MLNKNKISLVNKKKRVKVLFVAAEASPLAKVGGLGDVVGSLPKSLMLLGAETRLVLPFYKNLFFKHKPKLFKKNVLVELDNRPERFDLYQTFLPASKVAVYLLKHRFFDRPDIYWGSKKIKFNQHLIGDIERYTFFSKAVVELMRYLDWQPEVIHCHDWHTSLLPTYIDEYSIKYKNFSNIKTLLTIHNLANQGAGSLDVVDYGGLHHDLTPALMEDYYDKDGNVLDLLKVGILSADYINTVSPSYAKEILTKQYGEGLEKYLWRRKNNLLGIVNGIDTDIFDPQKDKYLYKNYSDKNFVKGKGVNKFSLQKNLHLELSNKPLFGLVTRLFTQKGLDILLPALEHFLVKGQIQLVFLGSGQQDYENSLKFLAKKYPKLVAGKIGFDIKLAQKIYAASDFFLMPSAFEPCGLGQMIAMRYGSLPIVRATGGLKDTVRNNKNGFVFGKYSSVDLQKAINKALRLYQNKKALQRTIQRAMREDFSWGVSAKQYIALYKKLLK